MKENKKKNEETISLASNVLKSFSWYNDDLRTPGLGKHIIQNLFFYAKKHFIRITLLDTAKYFL